MAAIVPEEIIAHIIGFLRLPSAHTVADRRGSEEEQQFHENVKSTLHTLCNVCRASKAFARIARPVLFAIYPGPHLVDSHLFAATLVEHPENRTLVREMVLSFPTKTPEYSTNPDDRYGRSVGALRSIIASANMPRDFQEFFIKDMETGHLSGVVPVLALLCSNVEILDINPIRDAHSPSITLIGRALYAVAPFDDADAARSAAQLSLVRSRITRLQSLKVRNAGSGDTTGVAMFCIGPVLDLPNVKSFSISDCNFGYMFGNYKDIKGPLRWPGISRIELTGVYVNEEGLKTILLCCPVLESLEVELRPTGNVILDRSALGDTLRALGTNLRSLKFDTRAFRRQGSDTRFRQDPTFRMEGLRSNLGSLRDLRHLKKLSATPKFLFGPAAERPAQGLARLDTIGCRSSPEDVLPSGLQELTILGSTSEEPGQMLTIEAQDQITTFLSSNMFPDFKLLRVHGSKKASEGFAQSSWDRVRDIKQASDDFEHPEWDRAVESADGKFVVYAYTPKV